MATASSRATMTPPMAPPTATADEPPGEGERVSSVSVMSVLVEYLLTKN